jgi:hypothetical protein
MPVCKILEVHQTRKEAGTRSQGISTVPTVIVPVPAVTFRSTSLVTVNPAMFHEESHIAR